MRHWNDIVNSLLVVYLVRFHWTVYPPLTSCSGEQGAAWAVGGIYILPLGGSMSQHQDLVVSSSFLTHNVHFSAADNDRQKASAWRNQPSVARARQISAVTARHFRSPTAESFEWTRHDSVARNFVESFLWASCVFIAQWRVNSSFCLRIHGRPFLLQLRNNYYFSEIFYRWYLQAIGWRSIDSTSNWQQMSRCLPMSPLTLPRIAALPNSSGDRLAAPLDRPTSPGSTWRTGRDSTGRPTYLSKDARMSVSSFVRSLAARRCFIVFWPPTVNLSHAGGRKTLDSDSPAGEFLQISRRQS